MRLAAAILLWCHTLAPHTNVRPMARAIAQVSRTREQAAFLTTVALYENTLSARLGVPFGACARLCQFHCTDCRTEPLAVTARAMLRTWHRSLGCSHVLEVRLGWYHTGVCRADAFSRNEARTMQGLRVVRPGGE